MRFHGLDVGPFTIKTTVRPGETIETATRRALKDLDRMAEIDLDERLPGFLSRVREVRKRTVAEAEKNGG